MARRIGFHGASAQANRASATDHSDEAKIGKRIVVQPDGCWLYNGKAETYQSTHLGRGSSGRYAVSVHRWVYETLVGPVPDGHDLHHECRTPGCCNPEHLTPLTRRDHSAQHHATDCPAR